LFIHFLKIMLLFIIKEPAINVSENQQHHLNEKHQEEIYELMSGIVTEEIFETEKKNQRGN